MVLKRHHKIMIGSLSTLIIICLVINSVLIYTLFLKLDYIQSSLSNDIIKNNLETQSKINELTSNIITTKDDLSTVKSGLGSINTQIDELKASASSDFSGIIDTAVPAVVTIKTDVSQGTGFIINEQGYVVTNAHILSGAHFAKVVTSDQKSRDSKLVGYTPEWDIALLKIDGTYSKLTLADSDRVQIGEKVIAIGNPLGLQFSVSEGIVSAINRPGSNEQNAYIQTDAALNPGNSGGPLINTKGEVIGMNNFKIGEGENLGFALESNYIKAAVNIISSQSFNQSLLA